MKKMLKKAKNATNDMLSLSSKTKKSILLQMAEALNENINAIIIENEIDMQNGKDNHLSEALLDRLMLNENRIKEMANSLKIIAKQDDPIGKVLHQWELQKGLIGKKVSVPLGVVCVIYESRPNVTSDTIGICFKSGNACILKGGKEALHSNAIIAKILQKVLKKNGLPKEIITFIKGGHEDIAKILKMDRYIDIIIPRGGEKLIKYITKNSTIPVIKHDKGLCHLYVDKSANFKKSVRLAINAKCQRPSACNAIETILVHKDIAKDFLPILKRAFDANDTKMLGCKKTRKFICIDAASKDDWAREYLSKIISIKVVEDEVEAIEHIRKYSSLHSESIACEDEDVAEKFLNAIDAAAIYLNASTRFTDGGMFGLGAEIGISTNKLHVRGPVGAENLTTYKYKIYGNGHVR